MLGKIEIKLTRKFSTGETYISGADLIKWLRTLENDSYCFQTPLEAIRYIKEGVCDLSL